MNQDRGILQKHDNDEITIDLSELLRVLWSKLHIIILTGILVALFAYVGTKLFITPTYTSSTKVYVLTRQNGNENITYTDLQTGTQLLKDYMELATSRPVLEQVIAELDLDIETEELQEMITTESQDDTRIFSISVECENPKKAKEIVDALREAVGSQITKIMAADAVNTVEEGNLPKEPSSPNLKRNVLVGGILGMLLAMTIIVCIYIMDDTIKTPDDVKDFLGLSVLTSIPIQEGVKKNKKAKGMTHKQNTRNTKNR